MYSTWDLGKVQEFVKTHAKTFNKSTTGVGAALGKGLGTARLV